MTAEQLATVTESVLASLNLAHARGELTVETLAGVLRAAGNNAAMSIMADDEE